MNQEIILYGLAVCFGIAGWFLRELWTSVKELTNDVSKLREDLPKNYIHKDDYRADIQRLFDLLEKINDKLDSKADK